tara:strand:- start:1532 stop:2563 length:1032 start_codon:yes stop_codon:yes gene_type:complete
MANGPETPNQTLNQAYQEILNQYTIPYLEQQLKNIQDTGSVVFDDAGEPMYPGRTEYMISSLKSGDYISKLARDYGGDSPFDTGIGIYPHDEDTKLGDITFIEEFGGDDYTPASISNVADLDFEDYQWAYHTDPTAFGAYRGHYPIPGDEAYTKGGYNFYETNYPGRNIVKRDGKVYTVHPQSGHQTLVADLTTEDPRASGIPFIPQTVGDVGRNRPYTTSSEITDLADYGTKDSYSTFERAEGILGEEIQGQELFNLGRETAKWNQIQIDLERQLKMGAINQEQYDLALNELFNIHKAKADEYMVGRGFSQAGSDVSGIDEANIMNEILGLDEVDLNTFPEE